MPNPLLRETLVDAIFESAPQGVIAVDSDGTIQLANVMAGSLFGYQPGELIGKSIEVLIPVNLREAHHAHQANYFAHPRPRPMGLGKDLVGRRKDGTEFPVEISLGPLGTQVIAFVTDITERKRLQTERDRFFELSPDLICIMGVDGVCRQVNPAFQRKLGWTSEELRSKPMREFIHLEDRENALEKTSRLLAGEDVLNFENRYVCKDGSIRWFQWSAPAPKKGDSVFFAVAREITEAKQFEEERKRSELRLHALTGQLFKVLSEERSRIARELHDDITQRLALLGIDLGKVRKGAGSESLGEKLGALQERIVKLSEDVRHLAHQFHPRILHHSGLLDAVEAHCHEVSRQTLIPVHFTARDVPAPLPQEISMMLYRIVQEALRNVAKHSNATSASVVLDCIEGPDGKRRLKVSIIDDGRGFLLADVGKGAGLGLLSIEERARLVHGTLAVRTEPGEGSRIEVEVPLPEESI